MGSNGVREKFRNGTRCNLMTPGEPRGRGKRAAYRPITARLCSMKSSPCACVVHAGEAVRGNECPCLLLFVIYTGRQAGCVQ